MSACSESEDLLAAYHSDPNAVRITAQVGKASADGFTRSNPLGDADAQTKFNKNDEISVKADDQEAVTYKFDGSEWQPQGGKFLKWEKETMNFTAYYPSTFNGTITQPTEYTSLESLAKADYMSFTGEQSNKNGNNLTLTMKRQMARVVVDVVDFNDQYDKNTPINSVSICGVTAYKHKDDGKFYALIKPCEAESTSEFLSLKVGANNAKETLTGIPALEAGKSYTYELTVGKNKISVSGITVKDWTTGMTITGGKAEYFPYVTFKANGEQKFGMYVDAEMDGKNYTFPNLEYSVNNGKWTPLVAGKSVLFGGANGDLRLRGTGNTNGTSSTKANETNVDNMDHSTIYFSTNEKVACEGDIRTLLDYKTYKTVNTNEACFFKLFYNCRQLTSAPDLPATNLARCCYNSMFSGCSSLSTAPDLLATTLAPGCYLGMFWGCGSLSKAPDLPATTLVQGCYTYMFKDCSSLSKAPDLPATTLAQSCYFEMFYNCKKISAVTMLAPKSQITNDDYRFHEWLVNAGTEASEPLTLKVQDADAYNALESYLPENWKIGTATVKDENNKNIE